MLRTALIGLVALASLAGAVQLNPPRIGDHPGYTRVVLDIPPQATFRLEPLGPALRLTLPGQSVQPAIQQVGTPELSGYVLEQKGSDAVLTLLTPQGVGKSWGFRKIGLAAAAGQQGERLVLDISGAFVDPAPLPQLPPFSFVRASGQLFSVVLDPGHGGPDPGAIGLVIEKAVNLEVARRVGGLLQAAGIEVTYTREDDRALSADKRSDLSKRVALAQGKHLFVSIHANAAPKGKEEAWCGLEVHYFGPPGKPVYPVALPLERFPQPVLLQAPAEAEFVGAQPEPELLPVTLEAAMGVFEPAPGEGPDPQPLKPASTSPLLAPAWPLSLDQGRRVELSRSLGVKLMGYLLSSTTASNRGLRTSDFFVTKHAPVPAVLVEMGYVTHPIEGLNLRNPLYLERIAYGIARGVLEYLEHDHPLQ